MSRAYYRKRSEATEQERVINWATFYAKDFPELDLLHHIPNGGSCGSRDMKRRFAGQQKKQWTQ